MITYNDKDGNTIVSRGYSIGYSPCTDHARVFNTKEEAIKASKIVNKIGSRGSYKPSWKPFTLFPIHYYLMDDDGCYITDYTNGEILYDSSKNTGTAQEAIDRDHEQFRCRLLAKAHGC